MKLNISCSKTQTQKILYLPHVLVPIFVLQDKKFLFLVEYKKNVCVRLECDRCWPIMAC